MYVTIIVFAVIRVISAIFLKDTLDEANNDAQQLVLDRLRKKAEYVARLENIFHSIDSTGEGVLTEARLTEILANAKVKAYFQTLELDVQEGAALFHLLDTGDGEVTLEEFISGIMRCSSPMYFGSLALGGWEARVQPKPSTHLHCSGTSASWTAR
ncbi:unnamed protein product, partial [Effrenium voratum]